MIAPSSVLRTGTSTRWISCAALYVGPDEEVPQDEQFNRRPQRAGVADAYCEEIDIDNFQADLVVSTG